MTTHSQQINATKERYDALIAAAQAKRADIYACGGYFNDEYNRYFTLVSNLFFRKDREVTALARKHNEAPAVVEAYTIEEVMYSMRRNGYSDYDINYVVEDLRRSSAAAFTASDEAAERMNQRPTSGL